MLIEALTYRLGPHTTSDDPTKYRSAEEAEQWRRKKDPLHRLRMLLEKRGLWTEEKEEAWVAQANNEITAAYEEAVAAEVGSAADVFDYVYAEPGKLLREQQQEVARRKQMKEVT